MRGFYGWGNAKLFFGSSQVLKKMTCQFWHAVFWAYQRSDIPFGNKIQTTIQEGKYPENM
jgi:hypothetical protein